MTRKKPESGYTTGACAAAAAKGAAMMLRDRQSVDEVEIILPRGETARFRIHGRRLSDDSATCFVVKDAGDDPDVTHGAEIHATVMMSDAPGTGTIMIRGGQGIGRITKPGLAVPVGEWAINPVPRRMITMAVNEVFSLHCPLLTRNRAPLVPLVTISIPNGEELAKKTLNTRLGIVGGLSILGTTGIVKPVSARAWTDTIDTAVDVALACGCRTVVLSTGRSSEMIAQQFFSRTQGTAPCVQEPLPTVLCPLPDEAYIMMGDHVGHSLRTCRHKGVENVVLAGQFAKLLKIACGHEQTHVSSSRLDLGTLAGWLDKTPGTSHLTPLASRANTARQVLEDAGQDAALVALVCRQAATAAAKLAPSLRVKVLLAGYHGEVIYFG